MEITSYKSHEKNYPFLITLIKQGSLVKQIIAGLVLGILVALAFPGFAQGCGVLGSFFVSALKAVAPVLVFVLVAASIANQESTTNTAMKDVIVLYLVGTFLAALVAVFASSCSRRRSHSLIRRMHYQRPAASAKL